MQAVAAAGAGLICGACLYDIYQPAAPSAEIRAGERSMTLRLELLDRDATLTDARIDDVVSRVLAALGGRLGMRLRG
jgi:phenylalanyl-tRNA synthetase beta chain